MKTREWDYIISPKEIYFTKDHRFPLAHVMEVAIYPAKTGTIPMVLGLTLLFIDFVVFGVNTISPAQASIFVLAMFLIGKGLLDTTAKEVGFVIIKDPKRYEKTFVSVYRTYSRSEAEKFMHALREELVENGREKARISINV